jgi:hypothetical protein
MHTSRAVGWCCEAYCTDISTCSWVAGMHVYVCVCTYTCLWHVDAYMHAHVKSVVKRAAMTYGSWDWHADMYAYAYVCMCAVDTCIYLVVS